MAVARKGWTVIDCPDPDALARFYADLLGGEPRRGAGGQEEPVSDRWVELTTEDGWKLAFQRAEDFVPPRWPSGERSQQMHLDVYVDDIAATEPAVLELGARALDTDDEGGKRGFRVYADPAGHPFCLVRQS
ncbi:VOC family protein [Streptomyces zingiberis]|uniref:VOC family protein n=1 Tax=Streptomyces zingiberis TaxID=2053010 RepID=A0ABX1BYI5_9ACTN|nr:VOC family protein [Streptomyces zingiberis]NJQ02730.1 VOC family protein [Streptomyces zingiberis]